MSTMISGHFCALDTPKIDDTAMSLLAYSITRHFPGFLCPRQLTLLCYTSLFVNSMLSAQNPPSIHLVYTSPAAHCPQWGDSFAFQSGLLALYSATNTNADPLPSYYHHSQQPLFLLMRGCGGQMFVYGGAHICRRTATCPRLELQADQELKFPLFAQRQAIAGVLHVTVTVCVKTPPW